MPHNAAFHRGLLCLLRQNQSSEILIQYCLEMITCDPYIYQMDHLWQVSHIKQEGRIHWYTKG